jgi:hypothetical protein
MEVNNLVGVAIGGLLAIGGGVVAQFMQGRREQHKWFEEKCIDEYRELLESLTKTLMLAIHWYDIDPESPTRKSEWDMVWNESLRIIHTRLFIAKQIKDADIFNRWTDAFVSFQSDSNTRLLSDRYEEIRQSIVALAMKKL